MDGKSFVSILSFLMIITSANLKDESTDVCTKCWTIRDAYCDRSSGKHTCKRCRNCFTQPNQHQKKPCGRFTDAQCACNHGFYHSPVDEICLEWKKCGPGFEVSENGTPETNVKCLACSPGTYSNDYSATSKCRTHTNCQAHGQVRITPGNLTHDAVCGPARTTSETMRTFPTTTANPPTERMTTFPATTAYPPAGVNYGVAVGIPVAVSAILIGLLGLILYWRRNPESFARAKQTVSRCYGGPTKTEDTADKQAGDPLMPAGPSPDQSPNHQAIPLGTVDASQRYADFDNALTEAAAPNFGLGQERVRDHVVHAGNYGNGQSPDQSLNNQAGPLQVVNASQRSDHAVSDGAVSNTVVAQGPIPDSQNHGGNNRNGSVHCENAHFPHHLPPIPMLSPAGLQPWPLPHHGIPLRPERPVYTVKQQKLIDNWLTIKQDLRPDDIFDHLIQHGVMTSAEKQRIKNTNHCTPDEASSLVELILTGGDEACDIFVNALRAESQGHLADLLT